MGNGYPTRVYGVDDGWKQFADEMKEHGRRLRELERPTGTQTFEAVKKIKEAINSIGTLVDDYLATGFTTGTIHATGSIDVDGAANVDGVLKNVTSYSNPIVSSFRSVQVTSVDGQFGFNLSSRRFKQDIDDFEFDLDALQMLRLVTFRYIQAVDNEGDDAEVHVGLIAEELHDAGFGWLVEYEDGVPYGVKFEHLALALLPAVQSLTERVAVIEAVIEGAAVALREE